MITCVSSDISKKTTWLINNSLFLNRNVKKQLTLPSLLQTASGMTKHISTIYTPEKSAFAASLRGWLSDLGFNHESFEESPEGIERIDAVVIFHDNHNFDRPVADLRDLFEKRQVAMHKVDLSGTMNVAISHLSLFFERTQCKHVLFLGSEALKDHPKMELFKEKWNL